MAATRVSVPFGVMFIGPDLSIALQRIETVRNTFFTGAKTPALEKAYIIEQTRNLASARAKGATLLQLENRLSDDLTSIQLLAPYRAEDTRKRAFLEAEAKREQREAECKSKEPQYDTYQPPVFRPGPGSS